MRAAGHKINGAKWCGKLCHEIGIRRSSNSFGSAKVQGITTDSAAECQEKCQGTSSCEYWSYNLTSTGCLLLSGPGNIFAPSANDSHRFISGKKLCERSRSELEMSKY